MAEEEAAAEPEPEPEPEPEGMALDGGGGGEEAPGDVVESEVPGGLATPKKKKPHRGELPPRARRRAPSCPRAPVT